MNSFLKMKHLVCMLLFLTAGVCMSAPAVEAGSVIGSTSNIWDCILSADRICDDSGTSFTVPVTYGNIVMIDATSPTDFVRGGTLEKTMRVEITKSVPTLIYPLRYLHTVAYAPYEEIRRVENTYPGVQECIDSAVENPSCGWTTQGGVRIPDSQGFCSSRELSFLETYRPDSSWWRGEEILGSRSTLSNSFSTGHCLRQGEIWFHGYEIGEYKKTYGVDLKFTKGASELTAALTPENPVFASDTDTTPWINVKTELLGDFDPYAAAPDLSNYILYIPNSPETNTMVMNYQKNMLLVPREMVTRDGIECDKVGVSFRKFRKEAGVSDKSEAGDCLANQLFHFHNEDIQKLAVDPDAETKYLVHGMKIFKGSMEFINGMAKALRHKIKDLNYSLVNLTFLSAPYVQLAILESESKGIIKSAQITTFTSMSREGTLSVIIANAGDYRTNYIVSVTDCSSNISKAIPAQARTLSPSEETTLTFDINTVQNMDVRSSCLVHLKSPRGKEYDSVQVFFDTLKHYSTYPRDLHLKNEESEEAQ